MYFVYFCSLSGCPRKDKVTPEGECRTLYSWLSDSEVIRFCQFLSPESFYRVI